MKTNVRKPEPRHKAFYDDITELLKKHGNTLTAPEMLALASNVVGKLIALQDQRAMTPAMAFKIVQENIEMGNKHAIEELLNSTPKGRA